MSNICPKCQHSNPSDTHYCGHCATPLPSSDDIHIDKTETLDTPQQGLTPGSIFANRYQLIEELGSGGMGTVYRAIDTTIEEEVALKQVTSEIAKDQTTIERFRNELKFARKIAHRNVCKMYYLGEEAGSYYITMEYIPGENLKSMIKMSGQLGVNTATRIAKQICEGLVEAHRLGVIHRDLKPSNIMIDKEGNARIMDFGVARSLKAKGITGVGVIIGTPEYMSPEQVESRAVDARSDIYSLGIILYEMVTGQTPFQGDSPVSIAVQHMNEPAPDPRGFNPHLPEEFSQLLLKCMEKDPTRRFQSAEEMLSALNRIEQATTKVIPQKKAFDFAKIRALLNKKVVWIPVLLSLIAVLVAVFFWLRPSAAPEPMPAMEGKPSLAVMYFKNNTGEENLNHWRKALSDLLVADLSQSRYLRVLSSERLLNILDDLDQMESDAYSYDILRRVADRGGVAYILVGDYAKAGNTFRLNVTIQNAQTGELIGSERVEDQGEENIFSMVDELTRRIKSNFRLSAADIEADIDQAVGTITTSSPEALRLYTLGVREHLRAEYRQAIQYYEAAVEIDPEFAMAYREMGRSYSNLGYDVQERESLEKAFNMTDRISERELYNIQAGYYRTKETTYEKALEAFEKLIALYPDEMDGNNLAGLLYKTLELWDEAIERFQVCIRSGYDNFFYYVNFAETYMAKGEYASAQRLLESYLDNFRNVAWVHGSLAVNYLCQNQFDLALQEAETALALDPDHYYATWFKGDIFQCQDDFGSAEVEFLKLLDEEEQIAHLFGRDNLAKLYLGQGKYNVSIAQVMRGIDQAREMDENDWLSWLYAYEAYLFIKSGKPEEAIKACDLSLENDVMGERLDLQRRSLFFKAYALIEMGELEQAEVAVEALREALAQSLNTKEMRFYHLIIGLLELKRGNPQGAIEAATRAIAMLPAQYYRHPWLLGNDQALFFDVLASAYNEVGDYNQAIAEYEKIIALNLGRLHYGDIYALSFYELGKIYAEQGNDVEATANLQKFLDLWGDADPDIPEIEAARNQLKGVASQH